MLLVLTAVIGCGGLPGGGFPLPVARTSPVSADCAPCAQVERMLDRRNRAVAFRQEAPYLQDLDPGNAQLVAHERMVFENLRQIPLATYSARALDPASGPQYLKGNPLNPYPYDVSIYRVGVWTQIADVQNAPTGALFDYALAMVSGHYRIIDIKDTSAGDAALVTGAPWQLTALHLTRSGDVIIGGDASVPDLDRFMAVAAQASQQVRKVWGRRPAPRALMVFLTRDEKTMESWYGDGDFAARADGVAHYSVPVDGQLAPRSRDTFAGAPVTVNVASTLLDTTPLVVLEHEFAHAISAMAVRPGSIPKWVLEGFAVWMSVLDDPQRQRALWTMLRLGSAGFTGELPADQSFYSGSPEDVGFHYALGFSVFSLLAQRWGDQKAVEIYSTLVSGRESGLPDGGIDHVLSDQGIDPHEFRASWRRYVETGG
jgi:hypothetical protein